MLMQNVCQALESKVKITPYLTPRLPCTLYLKKPKKQWVQQNALEILKITKKCDWGHIQGQNNPADLG